MLLWYHSLWYIFRSKISWDLVPLGDSSLLASLFSVDAILDLFPISSLSCFLIHFSQFVYLLDFSSSYIVSWLSFCSVYVRSIILLVVNVIFYCSLCDSSPYFFDSCFFLFDFVFFNRKYLLNYLFSAQTLSLCIFNQISHLLLSCLVLLVSCLVQVFIYVFYCVVFSVDSRVHTHIFGMLVCYLLIFPIQIHSILRLVVSVIVSSAFYDFVHTIFLFIFLLHWFLFLFYYFPSVFQ